MRLLGVSLLFLLVTGKNGPESSKREGPETVSPDEGSTEPQEEDGNEKDQTDEAGQASFVSVFLPSFLICMKG